MRLAFKKKIMLATMGLIVLPNPLRLFLGRRRNLIDQTVARRAAGCILTMPIYDGLRLSDTEAICDIVRHVHRKTWTKPIYLSARSSVPAGIQVKEQMRRF